MGRTPDLGQEAEALRQLVQEAHGVLKDLRAATREAERLAPELVRAQLKDAVRREVARLGDETKLATENAVARVNAKFDELADLLLGQGEQSRREGRPDLPELVGRLVESRKGEPGRTVTDARELGGDIDAGDSGPNDVGGVRFDTRGAVLLERVEVALAHGASDGSDDAAALLLSGKVNGTHDRARVLFLLVEEGCAALVAEVEALMSRAVSAGSARWWERYQRAKARRVAVLMAAGTAGVPAGQ